MYENENLGAFGNRANRHWKKYRPKMYAALEKSGQLKQALMEAQERTSKERSDLFEKGFQVFEANEIVLPKYVLLPPEDEVPALGEFNPMETVYS